MGVRFPITHKFLSFDVVYRVLLGLKRATRWWRLEAGTITHKRETGSENEVGIIKPLHIGT